MSFVKLKDNFFVQDYNRIKKMIVAYGGINPLNGLYDIGYDDVDLPDNMREYVLNVIPKEFQNKFKIRLMRINHYIGPHIDHGDRTTINFYINTDNCKTQFYDFVAENKPKLNYSVWIDGKETTVDTINPKIYSGGNIDPTCLIKTDSFVAKDNEAYCLDISKPHSVIPLDYVTLEETSKVRRLALMLGTTLPYTLVCEFLRQTKNID